MGSFFEVITYTDVAYALSAAFILTYLIKKLSGSYKFVGVYDNIRVNYDKRNLKSVLKSCQELFPKEIITFHGDTFRRGSNVQILTIGNRKITGELVGANKDNMICLVTAKHIIAHELSQVIDITLLERPDDINGISE